MAKVAAVDATTTGTTITTATGIMVEMATGIMPTRLTMTKGRSMRQMPIGMAPLMEVRTIAMLVLPEIMASMLIGPVKILERNLIMPRVVEMATEVAKLVMLLAGVRTKEFHPN